MTSTTGNKFVLMPHWLDGMNIYIHEIGKAYQRAGCEVIYGVDNLFEVTVQADIVHLHWPEAFYRWSGWGTVEERVDRFLKAVDAYKEQGAKIVWTIHNLSPHDHVKKGLDFDVYQRIAECTDLFMHHCPKSVDLFRETYQVSDQAAYIVQPHGHYLSYPSGISQAQAREKLNIPNDAFVYLHFGAIRSYKGLDTLLAAFRKIKHPKKWLLVAGNYRGMSSKGAWYDRLQMTWTRYVAPQMTLHLNSVPSNEIQTFFAASDSLVLSHSRGLNSGVAVLGMTLGKLIIGPRLGCMEWVLNSGRNILYEKDSSTGLLNAMEQAPTMNIEEVRKINSEVAASWSWDKMIQEILNSITE